MEQYDSNGLVELKQFGLRPLKYRPIRPHSIEFEFNGDKDYLMQMFDESNLGIRRDDYPRSYSEITQDTAQNAWAAMGDDCTVDGGELRFSKLNFASKREMKKLHTAFEIIDEAALKSIIDVNSNCGFHNHIDMHGVSEKEGEHLIDLWNYIEDPIFQIGAALTPGPRGECGPTPKQGFTCSSVRRGHGLNLDSFRYNTIDRCYRCRNGQSCRVDHGKVTAEFRVFNGTANMRKTLAYAALCQSMVAAAKLFASRDQWMHAPFEVVDTGLSGRYIDTSDWCHRCNDDSVYCQCEDGPMYEPSPSPAKRNGWQATTEQRLEWMFHRLPLSKQDKINLAYCVEKAPDYETTLTSEFINNLRSMPSHRYNQNAVTADPRGFNRSVSSVSSDY